MASNMNCIHSGGAPNLEAEVLYQRLGPDICIQDTNCFHGGGAQIRGRTVESVSCLKRFMPAAGHETEMALTAAK